VQVLVGATCTSRGFLHVVAYNREVEYECADYMYMYRPACTGRPVCTLGLASRPTSLEVGYERRLHCALSMRSEVEDRRRGVLLAAIVLVVKKKQIYRSIERVEQGCDLWRARHRHATCSF